MAATTALSAVKQAWCSPLSMQPCSHGATQGCSPLPMQPGLTPEWHHGLWQEDMLPAFELFSGGDGSIDAEEFKELAPLLCEVPQLCAAPLLRARGASWPQPHAAYLTLSHALFPWEAPGIVTLSPLVRLQVCEIVAWLV